MPSSLEPIAFGGPDPRNPMPAKGNEPPASKSSDHQMPHMNGNKPPMDPNHMPNPMHQRPPQGQHHHGSSPSPPAAGYAMPNGVPPHQFAGHPPPNHPSNDPRHANGPPLPQPPFNETQQQQMMMNGQMPMHPMQMQQMYHQMAMQHHQMMMRSGDMAPMPPLQHGQQKGPDAQPKEGDGTPAKEETGVRGSMSPMDFRQMPPFGPFPPPQGPNGVAPVPLREMHNVRGPPMSVEEMQARQAALATAGGVRPRQKSPNKSASLQDAASALLTMGTKIKNSEDGSADEAQESVDGDGSKDGDPNKKRCPSRLACPDDEDKLNSMHCFLRSELLEIFMVEDLPEPPPKPDNLNENSLEALEAELSHEPPPNSVKNRIGIRCVHCYKQKRQYGEERQAPMAVFYPKSLADLYRLVTSWQRVHLRKCRNLPKRIEQHYKALRATDKTRGKTHYWVTSAKKLGFKDSKRPSGGIIYEP